MKAIQTSLGNPMTRNHFSLSSVSIGALIACTSMTAHSSNLNFPPPAGLDNLRTRELFDSGWSFKRYGLQADGTRLAEPGAPSWEIAVTASSEEAEKGNPAVNAFDGDPATRWCANGPGVNQWLQLDLSHIDGVSDVQVTWEKSGGYVALLEGSNDGKSWIKVAPTAAAPVKARYLRIRTSSLPKDQWASIREVILTDGKGHPVKPRQIPTAGAPPQALAHNDWRKLDLPHDWGIEGPFRQELGGNTAKLPWKGIGWYQKSFTLPAQDKGKQVYLDFDGAMAYAKVWINGTELPARPYGYSAFRVDLTPHLKFGGDNLISVRLDTESWDSRWYPGAGIYRHTWLVKTQPVHIAQYGCTVTTPEITADSATVKVVTRIDNTTAGQKVSVKVDIHELAADDSVAAQVAGATGGASLEIKVPKPKLWDLSSPNRYLARTVVSIDGKPVDVFDTPFGIRSLEFTPRDGFKLNGKRVQIHGVCEHHDFGALGSALNNRALERKLQILQQVGVNALRTTHNPPPPEILDLADKMGLLVQVEAFDCWKAGKVAKDYNRLWDQWHDADLRDMVRQNRNHPSVFMWSIGNEIVEQDKAQFPHELVAIVKSEDSTRPVTAGCHNPEKAASHNFIQELDVMGVNYHLNFYAPFLKDPRFARIPVFGSETSSCVSSRGEYFFPVKRGRDSQVNFQVSSYDVDAPGWAYDPDTQFRALHAHPEVFGEFIWTGFDYLGEPTPYDGDASNLLNFTGDPVKRAALEKQLKELGTLKVPSRSSYFGVVDLAGFPKDRYYLYQGQWRQDLPMAHILPHWNWPERTGQVTPVHVYTSGDEAELFVNGTSQGRKQLAPGECRLRWDDVIYQPGEVRVVAYKQGKPWAQDSVKTTGAATQLDLTADRKVISNDGKDLAFITTRVTDKHGSTVPRAAQPIHFSVEGPGEIVATDNGDATSFESFQSPERRAFNGMALVIVRAKPHQSGEIKLTASADGLRVTTISLSAK
ncbi:MAG: beta-galactosidase GalB [Verrucomicrobiota bacterium]